MDLIGSKVEVMLTINKAVYTAAIAADGWAGAENHEKQICDGQTDRPTERLMDRKYKVAFP